MRKSVLDGTGEIVPQLQLTVAIARAKELLSSTEDVFEQQARNTGHNWRVEKDFKELEDQLNQVEPQYVSDKQAQRLALALLVDLPKFLTVYMEKIVKLGTYQGRDHWWVTQTREDLKRKLFKAISEQPTLRVQQNMQAVTKKAEAIASKWQADAAMAEAAIEFPAAPWISKAFSAHWKRLSEQWYAAYASANAVEDRFRLEQLATVHLPDSLRMFAELADAEPEVRTEAEELLAHQLVAAERQIQISSQRNSKDALTALRAQTAFMQEVAQITPGSLTLKGISS